MPIPQEINDFLSEVGLPTTAIALAVGLVRGAKALETDASPRALKYLSGLLTAGNAASFGKVGATLVPLVFDRVFGTNVFSFKFVSRSALATTIFWLTLVAFKQPRWVDLVNELTEDYYFYPSLALVFYLFDWLSLIKAKFIIQIISQQYAVTSGAIFLIADLLGSYLMSLFALVFLFCILSTFVDHEWPPLGEIYPTFEGYFRFRPLTHYFNFAGTERFIPSNVVAPSTMLTSIWTLLVFASCIVAQVLIPIDYLRRFTTWWFRDVERHPLTAIAKVAATLIIVGAVAIKTVRWI
jgi:hypothetical protein